MTSEIRIIKKYPNRRLYDTAISSYITLDDVKELVLKEIPIQVIDLRLQEDITHDILLQIIKEQEEKGPSLFTTQSLEKLIRLYSVNSMQVLQPMIEETMSFFSKQQDFLKETLDSNTHAKEDPVQFMSDLTRQNLENWQRFQQDLQKQWVQFLTPQNGSPSEEKKSPDKSSR